MDRVILHCDCNSFYASVETVLRPELKNVPMAVAGNPENRHGIILAKNELAKAYNVQTAETIWQARKKCPDLVCVAAHHNLYHEYYEKINAIYLEYTDLVEPFSVDESYLDVTHSLHLFHMTGPELADHLRKRIREELGITISVGVSFCKVFAKLGSDLKKPDATTVIFREDVPRVVYPLPVSSLLFVGKRSAEVLEQYSIRTCGELAEYQEETLTRMLGKQGSALYRYIHCEENSPVNSWYTKRDPKSIGNSITFKKDLLGEEEVKAGVNAIADSVAGRLRAKGKKAYVIQVGIKDPNFKVLQRQKKLTEPTHLKSDLVQISMDLIRENWDFQKPIRLLSITGADLVNSSEEAAAPPEQLSLFGNPAEEEALKDNKEKKETIESTVDDIRQKFGKGSITLGFTKKV